MICGVDEAGRGSVMGPLVVGCVYTEDESALAALGVKDSKKLSIKRRNELFDLIPETANDWCVVIKSAEEIDSGRIRQSLNEIELDMFQQAVSKIPVATVYADCPDVNTAAFSNTLATRLGNTTVIAEHKADDRYPVVSAASVMAKVTRDRMIEAISEEFGTSIGSGYPSDHFTMEFIEKWIKENGRPPKHTRCSWEPVKHMMSIQATRKITDW